MFYLVNIHNKQVGISAEMSVWRKENSASEEI